MKSAQILSIFLISLFLGCSRPDQRVAPVTSTGGEPEAGDWIIVRFEAEPDRLNRVLSTNAYASFIMDGANGSGVGEHLMRFNTSDWTFTEPLLAEAYPEISEDYLQYTFTIRDGVKWHDGHPLTSADVLFSVKAVVCPFVDSAPLRSSFGELANAEVLDGRKVRFTFKKRYFTNLFTLGFNLPILPKHVHDAEGLLDNVSIPDIITANSRQTETLKKFGEQFNRHPANRAPIGSGPYRVEKWDSGKEIVLIRNDDYWGKKPYLDRIIYRFISDETASLTALKAGEVDFIPRMQPIQYAQQIGGASFEQEFAKATYTIPSFQYIVWNQRRPFFKDKRVRQAMTMLINREQFIETVLFGLGKLPVSYFPPDSPEFNPNVKPFPYDPKRAAQLLDEAGWIDRNGDGVRDKDGIPFRFEFIGTANNRFVDQLLPIMKEEFRKVGIDMRERRLEFAVMVEQLKDKNSDASFLGWVMDLVADPYETLHSSSIENRGSNYGSFNNAESDRLLEAGRVEFDPEKRRQIYWRWQELINEEQPYTFMYIQERPTTYHRRFQNVKWIPLAPGYDLTTWFVPKPAQRFGK